MDKQGEMKMTMRVIGNGGMLAGVATLLLVSVALMGCESTERRRSLVVTPNWGEAGRAGDRVVLTASVLPTEDASISNQVSELLYPLEWSVSEPANGRIISTAGNTAVYYADVGAGNNVVTVRDQGDREGLATIN